MQPEPPSIEAPPAPRYSWRVGLLLLVATGYTLAIVVVGWATLALYYSNLPWMPLRLVAAVALAYAGAWTLWRAGAGS